MNKTLLVVVLVVVAAGIVLVVSSRQAEEPTATQGPSPTETATVTVSPSPTATATKSPTATTKATKTPTSTPTPTPTPQVKVFNVTGKPFSFTPSEIRVKNGDRVRIVFFNEQGNHDWTIDEFNARTPVIGAGQTAEVEFVANKTGTFEYYCSVGTHRQQGMKGNLIVE